MKNIMIDSNLLKQVNTYDWNVLYHFQTLNLNEWAYTYSANRMNDVYMEFSHKNNENEKIMIVLTKNKQPVILHYYKADEPSVNLHFTGLFHVKFQIIDTIWEQFIEHFNLRLRLLFL